MGCGKSSVGKKLSALLCCSFIDLDDAIEGAAGKTIPEIFASEGETEFRKMEKDTLQRIVRQFSGPDCEEVSAVLALGGGTVMIPECAEIVHEQTLCIYLRASVDTLVSHLEREAEGRPMLNTGNKDSISPSEALRKRISDLMVLRSPIYEKTAHIIIDTDGKTIDQIISSLSCISLTRSWVLAVPR